MKKITIILFLSFAIMSLVATNVYIWQNENETAHYPDPDTGEPLYAAEGIARILTELEVNHDILQGLSNDLAGYDVLVISCGTFCES